MNGAMIRLSFIFLSSLLLGLVPKEPFSHAGELPKEPILRIEMGRHTGRVERIGVDGENRHRVTGSSDKTVRVWELATGKLLRTLRPPIREANEGIFLAVAISPDGKTIACGGREISPRPEDHGESR